MTQTVVDITICPDVHTLVAERLLTRKELIQFIDRRLLIWLLMLTQRKKDAFNSVHGVFSLCMSKSEIEIYYPNFEHKVIKMDDSFGNMHLSIPFTLDSSMDKTFIST